MSDSTKPDDQNAGTPGKPDELSDKDLEQVSGGSFSFGATNTSEKWIEVTGNIGEQVEGKI